MLLYIVLHKVVKVTHYVQAVRGHRTFILFCVYVRWLQIFTSSISQKFNSTFPWFKINKSYKCGIPILTVGIVQLFGANFDV